MYVDFSNSKFPVGMNLANATVDPDDRALLVSELVTTFRGLWADSWGQRLQYILGLTLNALLECENVSLMGVPRMFRDNRYRAWVVKQIRNPAVRDFWTREFEDYTNRFREEAISPIQNKIGQLLMSPRFLNILGQVRNRIEARYMMDNGMIFIVNLAKGQIGETESRLIGAILINQFYCAAKSRSDIPDEKLRRPFFLHIDEFQSFIAVSFVGALAEVRKYGLSITLAHQYVDQLDVEMRSAVFGNVGTFVAFRVGFDDATRLESAFGQTFAAKHFTELENGEAYVRPLRHGRVLEPFLCRTVVQVGERHTRRRKIIRRCRERYGIPRSKIERRIQAWFGRSVGR